MWTLMPILVIMLTITLDQISKTLILLYLPPEGQVIIPGVFRFTYVENEGMAFGLLSDHRWVFLVLSSLGILLVIFYLYRFTAKALPRVALALIVGGGIGNMIDRLALGYVIDFLYFCAFPSIWPWVFNVADAAVCVGGAIFFITLIIDLINEDKKKKSGHTGEPPKEQGNA